MAVVKSVKQVKREKAVPESAKNTAPRARDRRPVHIVGGTGRIPKEIIDTPGPACPGAVELLIADRR